MKDLFQNIDTCLRTRELAARSLLDSLKSIGGRSCSEKDLKKIWRKKLSSNSTLFEKGWYEPPPDGFDVLVCDELNPGRLDFSSIRGEEFWPKPDIFFEKEKPAFLYCSPADKSGIIGDFAVTLYGGDDKEIREHLKKSFALIRKITEYAEVGMEMRELSVFASSLFDEYEVKNLDHSITSKGINVGHTIPWTNQVMTEGERAALKRRGNFEEIKEMISKKRIFIDDTQKCKIQENVVFTVEPKLKSSQHSNIPAVNFHTLVAFKGGKKTIAQNFSEIFTEWGMDYMEEQTIKP